MKVAINGCYGGFGLSLAAVKRLEELGMTSAIASDNEDDAWPDAEIVYFKNFHGRDSLDKVHWALKDDDPLFRTDSRVIRVIEELGADASGPHAEVYIVEIPDGVDFQIKEYDGLEWIAEKHRTWR